MRRNHGHDHHDMAAVLRHYGAEWVPDASGAWRNMRCPFHDDRSASAQTDGVGFRCFTCSLFYPAPLPMLKDREGGSFDDAHDRYHELVGAGDSALSVNGQRSLAVSSGQRHRPSSRRSGKARRRI